MVANYERRLAKEFVIEVLGDQIDYPKKTKGTELDQLLVAMAIKATKDYL